ncbi:lysine-sensitive aspartokinase 3 [Cysteiniphilum sp. JM-1]|uniref:lysine-sensitive aspartokinase 3 n=1 Tax=Cysteiniphilum sp. JM-1 TaxID=2610891 RepID=UPI001246E44E|nr:lysine-sensitive aspartokinase 3 [Cysteiniphilum sp. JM-1]
MQNPFVVAKFGGTSVANLNAICQCAEIIKSSPSVRVVVVSAQSGITNLLVKLAHHVKSVHEISGIVDDIKTILSPIIEAIDCAHLHSDIQQRVDDLVFLAQMSVRLNTKELSDEILSFGERISAQLVAAIFRQNKINAQYFNVQTVMKTNSNFSQAKPNLDEIKAQVTIHMLPLLLADQVLICEGFIGMDSKGKTTTLGRGGSDYSAALLAQALQAKSVKIWTDVAGIYEADPRTIPQARAIESLSFNEAAELATFGAKVLHPATLWPAISSNIDVFVGSTFSPKMGGTWITAKANSLKEPPQIRAIAERKNQLLMTLKSFDMFHAQGFLAKVFSILAKHNISVDLVTTSEVSIALTLDHIGSQSIGESLLTEALLDELQSIGNLEISVEHNLSLIAVVGNRLHQHKGVSAKLFAALESYNVRLFSHGASGHNICLLVAAEDAKGVMMEIYMSLFSESTKECVR